MKVIHASKEVRKAIAALNPDQMEALKEEGADSWCPQMDDPGLTEKPEMTGYEVFMSGYELAIKAQGKSVVAVQDLKSMDTYFFIGDNLEALNRIRRIVKENPEEP